MKRATTQRLRTAARLGDTTHVTREDCADILDSEKRLKAEVRRLKKERDALADFMRGMAVGFERQGRVMLAKNIRTGIAALRPAKKR